jgi:hypothetical protein
MNWTDFMDFLLQEGKKKLPNVSFSGEFLPKPDKVSKPFSKERDAEIRALMKVTGRSAIMKDLKQRKKSSEVV